MASPPSTSQPSMTLTSVQKRVITKKVKDVLENVREVFKTSLKLQSTDEGLPIWRQLKKPGYGELGNEISTVFSELGLPFDAAKKKLEEYSTHVDETSKLLLDKSKLETAFPDFLVAFNEYKNVPGSQNGAGSSQQPTVIPVPQTTTSFLQQPMTNTDKSSDNRESDFSDAEKREIGTMIKNSLKEVHKNLDGYSQWLTCNEIRDLLHTLDIQKPRFGGLLNEIRRNFDCLRLPLEPTKKKLGDYCNLIKTKSYAIMEEDLGETAFLKAFNQYKTGKSRSLSGSGVHRSADDDTQSKQGPATPKPGSFDANNKQSSAPHGVSTAGTPPLSLSTLSVSSKQQLAKPTKPIITRSGPIKEIDFKKCFKRAISLIGENHWLSGFKDDGDGIDRLAQLQWEVLNRGDSDSGTVQTSAHTIVEDFRRWNRQMDKFNDKSESSGISNEICESALRVLRYWYETFGSEDHDDTIAMLLNSPQEIWHKAEKLIQVEKKKTEGFEVFVVSPDPKTAGNEHASRWVFSAPIEEDDRRKAQADILNALCHADRPHTSGIYACFRLPDRMLNDAVRRMESSCFAYGDTKYKGIHEYKRIVKVKILDNIEVASRSIAAWHAFKTDPRWKVKFEKTLKEVQAEEAGPFRDQLDKVNRILGYDDSSEDEDEDAEREPDDELYSPPDRKASNAVSQTSNAASSNIRSSSDQPTSSSLGVEFPAAKRTVPSGSLLGPILALTIRANTPIVQDQETSITSSSAQKPTTSSSATIIPSAQDSVSTAPQKASTTASSSDRLAAASALLSLSKYAVANTVPVPLQSATENTLPTPSQKALPTAVAFPSSNALPTTVPTPSQNALPSTAPTHLQNASTKGFVSDQNPKQPTTWGTDVNMNEPEMMPALPSAGSSIQEIDIEMSDVEDKTDGVEMQQNDEAGQGEMAKTSPQVSFGTGDVEMSDSMDSSSGEDNDTTMVKTQADSKNEEANTTMGVAKMFKLKKLSRRAIKRFTADKGKFRVKKSEPQIDAQQLQTKSGRLRMSASPLIKSYRDKELNGSFKRIAGVIAVDYVEPTPVVPPDEGTRPSAPAVSDTDDLTQGELKLVDEVKEIQVSGDGVVGEVTESGAQENGSGTEADAEDEDDTDCAPPSTGKENVAISPPEEKQGEVVEISSLTSSSHDKGAENTDIVSPSSEEQDVVEEQDEIAETSASPTVSKDRKIAQKKPRSPGEFHWIELPDGSAQWIFTSSTYVTSGTAGPPPYMKQKRDFEEAMKLWNDARSNGIHTRRRPMIDMPALYGVGRRSGGTLGRRRTVRYGPGQDYSEEYYLRSAATKPFPVEDLQEGQPEAETASAPSDDGFRSLKKEVSDQILEQEQQDENTNEDSDAEEEFFDAKEEFFNAEENISDTQAEAPSGQAQENVPHNQDLWTLFLVMLMGLINVFEQLSNAANPWLDWFYLTVLIPFLLLVWKTSITTGRKLAQAGIEYIPRIAQMCFITVVSGAESIGNAAAAFWSLFKPFPSAHLGHQDSLDTNWQDPVALGPTVMHDSHLGRSYGPPVCSDPIVIQRSPVPPPLHRPVPASLQAWSWPQRSNYAADRRSRELAILNDWKPIRNPKLWDDYKELPCPYFS